MIETQNNQLPDDEKSQDKDCNEVQEQATPLPLNSHTLPERYRGDDAIPCMLYSDYSSEAKEVLEAVKEKAREWLGEEAFEDGGSLFTMSMTLFLTAKQKQELKDIIAGSSIELYSVDDLSEALQAGIQGASRIEKKDERKSLSNIEYMQNAGSAVSELKLSEALTPEQERNLVFEVWNGMVQLHNVALSTLKDVQRTYTKQLIEELKQQQALAADASVFEVARKGVYKEADRLTAEYSEQSEELKKVQELSLVLARVLLERSSPDVKEIVYTQVDANYHLLGKGLALYGPNEAVMINALTDWENFFDSQIGLLPRYFEETKREKAAAKASGQKWESSWGACMTSCGDKVAITPCQYKETYFHDIRNEHLWGLKFIGVPGDIGDHAFEVVSGALQRANETALDCRPAYVDTEVERDAGRIPDLDGQPEEIREAYERYLESQREQHEEKGDRLVHGMSNLILSGLPWHLPRKDMPLIADPECHLNRVYELLESNLDREIVGSGLADTARQSTQELAIQLEHWDYVDIFDSNQGLADKFTKLFVEAEVRLPDDWCKGLREKGILAPNPESMN